jgi:hypothetical protein
MRPECARSAFGPLHRLLFPPFEEFEVTHGFPTLKRKRRAPDRGSVTRSGHAMSCASESFDTRRLAECRGSQSRAPLAHGIVGSSERAGATHHCP